MTSQQLAALETAARALCTAAGGDPDEVVPWPLDPVADANLQATLGPRWHVAAREIKKFQDITAALA